MGTRTQPNAVPQSTLPTCSPLLVSQLGTSDTLSVDVSGIVRDDFGASAEANVTQLVAGWTPLLDSSLKGSAVVNASTNSSYEEYEVGCRPFRMV